MDDGDWGIEGGGGSGEGCKPRVIPLVYEGSGYYFLFRMQVENPEVQKELKKSLSLQNRAAGTVRAGKSCLLGGIKKDEQLNAPGGVCWIFI